MRGGKMISARILLALLGGIGIGSIAHSFYVNSQENTVYSNQRIRDLAVMQTALDPTAVSGSPPNNLDYIQALGKPLPFNSAIPAQNNPPAADNAQPSIGGELTTAMSSPEATAIANSITIITLLIAIYNWLSKKQSTDSMGLQKQASLPSETDIVAIRLHMAHGRDREFKKWLTEPYELIEYIDTFNQQGTTNFPVSVVFVQKNGEEISEDVLQGTQNNPRLDLMLRLLAQQ